MHRDEYEHGRNVTLIGIAGNIFVTIVEFYLGIIGRSAALVADALHSLSDVGATVAVLFGLKYSSRPKDKNHPYGHGKIESIIALFLGIILGVMGIYLIYNNIDKIYNRTFLIPEWYTLGAALLTIVVKEWMFHYTIKAGKKLNSPSISANAYHQRSDVLTSIGVFFGILGSYLGFPILDPVVAIIVAVFIIRMAFTITKDALWDLTDVTISDELCMEIEKVTEKWNSEYHVVDIIGRRMGTRYHVDIKIKIEPYIAAIDGVADLRALEKQIKKRIPVIQAVDIKGIVDSEQAENNESIFKYHVNTILSKYESHYRAIKSLEFHFLPNQAEAHFNMIVDPAISVGEAHDITNMIERDIMKKFDHAQVIIHVEPDE